MIPVEAATLILEVTGSLAGVGSVSSLVMVSVTSSMTSSISRMSFLCCSSYSPLSSLLFSIEVLSACFPLWKWLS